jgi:hypothetical protein
VIGVPVAVGIAIDAVFVGIVDAFIGVVTGVPDSPKSPLFLRLLHHRL